MGDSSIPNEEEASSSVFFADVEEEVVTQEVDNPFEREREGEERPNKSTQQQPPVVNPLSDPLVRMATGSGTSNGGSETRDIPLFGEVPVDASIAVLGPVIVIGLLGFVMSFVIAIQSKDQIIDALATVNDVKPPPQPKVKVVSDKPKCRGICSNQDESFETLKNVMESFSNKPK